MTDNEKPFYNGYKPDDHVPIPPSNRLPPDAAMIEAMDEEKTLRDEIAIAALQGLLSNTDTDLRKPCDTFAKVSYEYADAMLAQRGEG